MADETVKSAVASAVVDKAKAELSAVGQSLDTKASAIVSAHKLGYLFLAAASAVAGFVVGKFV